MQDDDSKASIWKLKNLIAMNANVNARREYSKREFVSDERVTVFIIQSTESAHVFLDSIFALTTAD